MPCNTTYVVVCMLCYVQQTKKISPRAHDELPHLPSPAELSTLSIFNSGVQDHRGCAILSLCNWDTTHHIITSAAGQTAPATSQGAGGGIFYYIIHSTITNHAFAQY